MSVARKDLSSLVSEQSELWEKESLKWEKAGLYKRVAEKVRLEVGEIYLDVGCGSGRMFDYVSGIFPNNGMVGFDCSFSGLIKRENSPCKMHCKLILDDVVNVSNIEKEVGKKRIGAVTLIFPEFVGEVQDEWIVTEKIAGIVSEGCQLIVVKEYDRRNDGGKKLPDNIGKYWEIKQTEDLTREDTRGIFSFLRGESTISHTATIVELRRSEVEYIDENSRSGSRKRM